MSERSSNELVWTPEMIARFWDHEAQFPERYFSFQTSAALVEAFRGRLADRQAIVDYGAGTGHLVEDLLAAGYRCAALEHAETGVAKLKARFAADSRFIGAWQIDDPGLGGEQFDAAFLIEVVEHLYDDALAAAFADIHRLLRPGGILIVTTPNEEDLRQNMIASPESGRLFHRWQHVRSWSGESLAGALRTAGFSDIETGARDFTRSRKALQRNLSLPQRMARLAMLQAQALADPARRPPHLYAVAVKPAGTSSPQT